MIRCDHLIDLSLCLLMMVLLVGIYFFVCCRFDGNVGRKVGEDVVQATGCVSPVLFSSSECDVVVIHLFVSQVVQFLP